MEGKDLEYKRRTQRRYSRASRVRKRMIRSVSIAVLLVLILIGIGYGGFRLFGNGKGKSIAIIPKSSETEVPTTEATTESAKMKVDRLLEEASRVAASYDYDGAISMLQADTEIATDTKVTEAIAEYEQIKTTLVKQDISTIPHVFFHTLIYDTDKAFDGDGESAGYNEVMTTIEEFNKMIQSIYDRGFVLVGMHDIAYEVDDPETGGKKMVAGEIMLPPGKKPIVISQDDVCYYEYMVGDGFASRLIIGEDGRVTTEMDMDDGSKQVGSYDMIPLLNEFIDEHPDFSYRGSKAIIAVTGYNGVFGYRTDASYADKNPNFEADKQMVTAIAQALKDDGYELASHSWGHRHLGKIAEADFREDCDKWQNNVESLIGETDILIFPFGTDVADWRPYKDDNTRYVYLRDQGFRYFCNVDSAQAWVQLGKNSLRQGRRNLDGYRMWRDITEPDNPKLSDLFDSKEVFDKARPTPVGVIRS